MVNFELYTLIFFLYSKTQTQPAPASGAPAAHLVPRLLVRKRHIFQKIHSTAKLKEQVQYPNVNQEMKIPYGRREWQTIDRVDRVLVVVVVVRILLYYYIY